MPIRGFVRMRRHQFGLQTAFGTPVAATRRVGARGVPDVNPNWTDVEDVDTGSLDPVLKPYRMGMDVALPLAFNPLAYNDIPLVMAALIEGGVTPTAGATDSQEWVHTAKSPAVLDYFTDEFADDVNLNEDTLEDGMQLYGGIIQQATWTFDPTLGPWQMSTDWMFAGAKMHVTPTPGLVLPTDTVWAYGEDTALYIDDTAGGIGGTKIADSLISATVTITNEIDVKRFANGLQAADERFIADGMGVAARDITVVCRFEKTADIVDAADSETVDWFASDAVDRFVRFETTSLSEAEAGVPYSWLQDFAGTWRTRVDNEEGGNAIVELSMTAHEDQGALGTAFKSTATNTQDATP